MLPPTPFMRRTCSVALLCACAALPALPTGRAQAQSTVATAAGSSLTVNRPLPTLRLTDQHDQVWQIPAHTRLVLFAAGRKAANLVQAVLAKEPPDFLPRHDAVYVVDMSKMPAFATRMFALPALREMPFRVGVSMDEAVLLGWPRQPDAVTLIALTEGTVAHIGHAHTESELRTALAR